MTVFKTSITKKSDIIDRHYLVDKYKQVKQFLGIEQKKLNE